MPVLRRDGLSLQYWVDGDGHPLMLFAPGGMQSVAQLWRERPGAPGQPLPWIDPTSALASDFQVISMDQRNAGASTAPVEPGDGWATYTGDHLALMEELGIERAHVMGGCIGSSYCLSICRAAPDRVTAAVLQNPIGLTADNRARFAEMFDGWARALRDTRPDVGAAALDSLREHMFGGDFVFSVDREFVARCPVPLLVLAGHDEFHPTEVAEEIADLAPAAELVVEWAGPEHHAVITERIREFLLAHTRERQAR